MKAPDYWTRYVIAKDDIPEIKHGLETTTFTSNGEVVELIQFSQGPEAPSIVISPGSGGHGYVFVELGYRMYERGYNVFIMPAHGGRTITELVRRHEDALRHVTTVANDRIAIFGEGLGGFAAFYLALAGGPVRSLACQNSPAILTEAAWLDAISQGRGAALRRRVMLPIAKAVAKVVPGLRLPISVYLDFEEMVDTKLENRQLEAPLVAAYRRDPDFIWKYPLSAIMSLVTTPPPRPLADLTVPTMFLLPSRGFVPAYARGLFDRLPPIKKKLAEVDGSVFWMVSHPWEAANIICTWFDETLPAVPADARAASL